MGTKRGKVVAKVTEREKILLADVLLSVVLDFLQDQGIEPKKSAELLTNRSTKNRRRAFSLYERAMATWSCMARLMETWHSDPAFLDKRGLPVEVECSEGPHSIQNLMKAAEVTLSKHRIMEMLQTSPSISQTQRQRFKPLNRAFIVPNAELLRAAFVVQRFLMTVGANARRHESRRPLVLERNCYVLDADLARALPIMRDIKDRASAFMDSVDWELESCRTSPAKKSTRGELGVLVFAWSRPSKSTRTKHASRAKVARKA